MAIVPPSPSQPPPRRVVISGLPGRMAALVGAAIASSAEPHLLLADLAFGGRAAAGTTWSPRPADAGPGAAAATRVHLAGPPTTALLAPFAALAPRPLVIDYSTPMAATANALACAEAGLPFVMGTTGADVALVERAVRDAGILAVLAPNMAAPIVVLMAMLDWAAGRFPGALDGLDLAIAESHQAAKRDVSGTARRLLPPLARLAGLPADEARITSVRDPDAQRALGIPEEALGGHAWHRYALAAPEGDVSLVFEHRVLGRAVYVAGTLRAARCLDRLLRADGDAPRPGAGRLLSMLDVLHEGAGPSASAPAAPADLAPPAR